MEIVSEGLNFPTSIAIAGSGEMYVAESGLPFGGAPPGGSVSRLRRDGSRVRLLSDLRFPVNGLVWHQGSLIVSEGGNPGRIGIFDISSGKYKIVLDGLPGFGNYHTNMAVPGPDGKIYFSQGALTNSGVIGVDSRDLAWLREVPHNCDIPGFDIALTDYVAETADPIAGGDARARTGAFAPFGNSAASKRIEGRVPCTASVMRCNADGSGLELVAWGLRNAYGLGFLPDGRLLATDQGADARGSRPIPKCPDFLYEVRQGAWYGWPDFFGGEPAPNFLLANHAELPAPERPLLKFAPNSCAVKFAAAPKGFGPFAGDLVVALFGDEKPMTAPAGAPVGRTLLRVAASDWSTHPVRTPPLRRPIDVAFHHSAAYVLDFGEFEMKAAGGLEARAGSGRLWKLAPDFLEV